MASFAQWVSGARPRTLPNAVAPVIAGTGAAAWLHSAVWWKALLALAVAVGMIVGVNYANDYSDGIRGTDDDRAGPMRLVGSRLAAPRSVLAAAVVGLLVASTAGLALALVTEPWLIAVGVACVALRLVEVLSHEMALPFNQKGRLRRSIGFARRAVRKDIDIAPAFDIQLGPYRQEIHHLPRQFRAFFARQHIIISRPRAH